MGLCSHTVFFCSPRGLTAGVGSRRESTSTVDRVDRSPRDHLIRHVGITYLKWRDRRDRRWPRGRFWSAGSSSNGELEARSRRTGLTNRDRPSDRKAIGRCRDEVEEPRDRLVIAARSSRNHTHASAESTPLESTRIGRAPGSRSTHDRDPIAARSWSKRGAKIVEVGGLSTVKSGQNWRGFEAMKPCKGNRLHEAWKPPPRPPLQPTIPGQFPSLKTHVLLLSSSTFDWFVKELSEFRGKS